MARLSAGVLIPGLDVTANSKQPMTTQLAKALREAVIAGVLESGTRMPSSRSLANDLNVSRTTVLQAYERLKAEGYLEGREKSGTFVRTKSEGGTPASPASPIRTQTSRTELPVRLSKWMGRADFGAPAHETQSLPFNPGIPAIRDFPTQQFTRIYRRVSIRMGPSGSARCPPEGAPQLREQVAAYLRSSRRVVCDPEQVFIVSGTRQALHAMLLALANPGDKAWAEDPGYPGAPKAFRLHGLKTVPVPIDKEGMMVSVGRELADNARFAYVTPARQAPLGHTLSPDRRTALLDWAYDRDALVLEDDYDGEYRFGGYPSPSLQSLDPDGRVFYFGTFSKTLLPALGIGYLVVPRRYAPAFPGLLDAIARPPSLATQVTVAEFLQSGAFDTHIRHMRDLYKKRQTALRDILQKELGETIRIEVLNAGLHLIAWLPEGMDDEAVKERALKHGLLPRPLSEFSAGTKHPPALMLGFADLRLREMPAAASALARAIAETTEG